MKTYKILMGCLLVAFSSTSFPAMTKKNILSRIPPDKNVAPCVREITTEKITRSVIPIEPFRSVNFIFPFKLEEGAAFFALSSDKIWGFIEPKGQNILTVYTKNFGPSNWGTVNDLSVAVKGYIFSLALKAEPGRHCSNIVFTLSEEEKKKIIEGEKKQYLEALKNDYDIKFKSLDTEAEKRALVLVGALASKKTKVTRVHEEDSLSLSNGDDIIIYANEILGFGKFSVLSIEIENDSAVNPLYIKFVRVYELGKNKRTKLIEGAADFSKKMAIDSTQEISFTTLDNIPKTGGFLVVGTDQGEVTVKW